MEEMFMSEEKDTKVWTTRVEWDEEVGEMVILFPTGLLEEVGWKEGDNLAWVVDDDNRTCIISKLNTPEG